MAVRRSVAANVEALRDTEYERRFRERVILGQKDDVVCITNVESVGKRHIDIEIFELPAVTDLEVGAVVLVTEVSVHEVRPHFGRDRDRGKRVVDREAPTVFLADSVVQCEDAVTDAEIDLRDRVVEARVRIVLGVVVTGPADRIAEIASAAAVAEVKIGFQTVADIGAPGADPAPSSKHR